MDEANTMSEESVIHNINKNQEVINYAEKILIAELLLKVMESRATRLEERLKKKNRWYSPEEWLRKKDVKVFTNEIAVIKDVISQIKEYINKLKLEQTKHGKLEEYSIEPNIMELNIDQLSLSFTEYLWLLRYCVYNEKKLMKNYLNGTLRTNIVRGEGFRNIQLLEKQRDFLNHGGEQPIMMDVFGVENIENWKYDLIERYIISRIQGEKQIDDKNYLNSPKLLEKRKKLD